MLPVKPSFEDELKELEKDKKAAIYYQRWDKLVEAERKIRKVKKQISDSKNLQLNFEAPKPEKRIELHAPCAPVNPRTLPAWFNKRPEQVFPPEKPLGIREAMEHGFWLCAECAVRVEIEDPDKRRCPHCGSARVHFRHR